MVLKGILKTLGSGLLVRHLVATDTISGWKIQMILLIFLFCMIAIKLLQRFNPMRHIPKAQVMLSFHTVQF